MGSRSECARGRREQFITAPQDSRESQHPVPLPGPRKPGPHWASWPPLLSARSPRALPSAGAGPMPR